MKLHFNPKQFADVASELQKRVKRFEAAIEFQIINIEGPKSTAHAKTYRDYKDQTGNLTSSKGFILAKDGQIVDEGGFKAESGTESGSKGVNEGREYARELAISAGRGYVLIIVAGMPYASNLESKGYNVLTKTGSYLEKRIKAMVLKTLKQAGLQ